MLIHIGKKKIAIEKISSFKFASLSYSVLTIIFINDHFIVLRQGSRKQPCYAVNDLGVIVIWCTNVNLTTTLKTLKPTVIFLAVYYLFLDLGAHFGVGSGTPIPISTTCPWFRQVLFSYNILSVNNPRTWKLQYSINRKQIACKRAKNIESLEVSSISAYMNG